MKNVLLISSSPRKGGNSDLLCDAFAKGAEEAGNKVRKVRLADKKIAYWTESVEEDDAAEVLDQMCKADVIVLASPVYFYSICGQLKVLIDRCVAISSNLKNKQFYFLIAMASNNRARLEGPVMAMQGFVDCCKGSVVKGKVLTDSVYEKGDVEKTKFLEEAYELGKKVN